MNLDLSRLDKRISTVIDEVATLADRKGLSAYIVGGIVRDMILGRKNFDLDIVIEGNAISLAEALAKKKKAQVTTYKKFGTATTTFADGLEVDFAMARKEEYVQAGALPAVKAGSIRDDLFRRDFTINALAVMINKKNFGELVDLFRGVKDIQKGRVRVLHKKSFIDDPTRILRAVRFEQRFGFSLERRTRRLLKAALAKGAVDKVKPPRYFTEFRKMLKEPLPIKCIRRLHKLGALGFLGENFRVDIKKLNRLSKRLRKVCKDFYYQNLNWSPVYLMAIWDGLTVFDIEKLFLKFHLTRTEKEFLLVSHRAQEVIRKLRKRGLRASDVYQILSPLTPEIVHFIRVGTSSKLAGPYIDDFLFRSRFVKLHVTGDDLRGKGITSGKQIGIILHNLLLKKIDGKISTRRDELREAEKFF